MSQTIPATCVLGPGLTGLTIGVTVLNVDGTEYAAFSTTGVSETSVAGTYRKAGGVVVPDAGGYLVWGVSGTAYAEATVEPSAAAAVLVTPANKIDTGAAGQITTVTNLTNLPAAAALEATLTAMKGAGWSAGYNMVTTQDQLGEIAADLPNSVAQKLIVYDTSYAVGDIATGSAADIIRSAISGADGDTLKTLSDQIDGIGSGGLTAQETADAVYNLAPTGSPATGSAGDLLERILEDTGTTIPGLLAAELSNTSDSTASGAITRTRGNTWTINATIGAITGYTSLWFTVKHSQDDADDEAILQIKLNSSGTDDDLLYVNGATATDATKGTITVSDDTTGAIIIAVDETVTDDMPVGTFYYDIQALIPGAVTTPDSGTFTITADVTRSVT